MQGELRWLDPDMPPHQALQLAASLFTSIPAGWNGLWRETLRSFIAARTEDRTFALTYLSCETEDGILMPDMPETDAVLDGITRRCAARSRHICCQCARPGRWRQFGMYTGAVLCARCAAPELLHRAIEDAIQYPGLIAIGGFVNGVDLVPAVLRKHFLRAEVKTNASNGAPRMDKLQLRDWIKHLEAIKPQLPPRHEFGN